MDSYTLGINTRWMILCGDNLLHIGTSAAVELICRWRQGNYITLLYMDEITEILMAVSLKSVKKVTDLDHEYDMQTFSMYSNIPVKQFVN